MPSPILYGPPSQARDTHTSTQGQRWPLGTLLVLQDGRRFRYAKMGSTAGVAGSLYQSEVPDGDHDTLATAANGAVGDRTITITNGSDAIEADLYAEGYAVMEQVAANAGGGRAYKIEASHDAISGSVSGAIPLAAGEGVEEAFVAGTGTVTLVKSPYDDVIIHPSPPTAAIVGVAAADIPASGFGWLQVHGPCACLIEGTMVIGTLVSPSDGTDGALESAGLLVTNSAPKAVEIHELIPVGVCMEVAPSGDAGMVFLLLD